MTRSLTLTLAAAVAAVALPLAAQESHGINPADMETSAKACVDFFHYADGGWIKAHPIPPEYPRWGTFNVLAEENRDKLHGILEALAARKDLVPGSDDRKLADFWGACMDEKAVEAAGAKPIEPELARIDAIKSVADLQAEVARLQSQGVRVLFGFGSEQDRKNSDEVIASLRQGGLGLPDLDWPAYFRLQQAPAIASLNVAQPEFIRGLGALLARVPLEQWKTYLRWHLVSAAAPHLSSAFVNEEFQFQGKALQGTEKLEARWRRCVGATDRQLGFALGRLYVEKYFPSEAKKQADQLVHNLIAALRADIATLDWMGPETKKAAIAKLDAFTPKIGYPDTWRDYAKYDVKAGSFADNVVRGNDFEFHRVIDKVGKPVDLAEWGMTPPTVNAYYSPSRNEIVFPAGILQPPFFDPKADAAVNYGAIGAVIGHEMTHGFDDQGRKFDAKGNLKEWWTAEDAKNYEARAACVQKQFEAYEVQPGLHENGKLVLGESIADLGGLTIAHMAYEASLAGAKPPVIGGLTADQRFFLAFARVWAGAARPEYEQMQVRVDPHPAAQFRAIGAPSNMPAFAAALGCKPGDQMVRAEQCRIW